MLLNVLLSAFVLHVGPGEDLAKVRDTIRDLPAAKREKGVEIVLAPGRYSCSGGTLSLNAEDSGRHKTPVLWRSSEMGRAVLSQGTEIPPSSFVRLKDPAVLKRLPDEGRERVLTADLSKGSFRLGAEIVEKERRYPLPIPELFVDGRRMVPAAWPNGDEYATIDRFVEEGTRASSGAAWDTLTKKKEGDKALERKGGVFGYAGDRPARWTQARGLLLRGFWCFDWCETVLPVKTVDAAAKTIAFACPSVYGVRKGNPSPRRWRAVNLLEELDAPGEFYVDREQAKLYLCPPEGFSASSRVVFVPCGLGDLVRCEGVSDVVFRGIGFEDGFGNAVTLKGCTRVAFDCCSFRNLRQQAVEMADCSTCVLRGCTIRDVGTGGITLGGGDRRTLTPGRNRAEDCVIRNFSVQNSMYTPAIRFVGVGNVARHCELTDAVQMAVSINGNDHVFEYNVVSNVCTCSDDAAALYKGRNPSCRGNQIRYNLWKDIGSPRGHGTAAIYFDDGDGGDTVFGNVFVRCGEPGKGSFGTVFSHGGYSNIVANCLFVACRRPLGSGPWDQKRWTECVQADYWQKLLTRDVDIRSETYLSHYPALAGFLDPHPDEQRWNAGFNNVFISCDEVSKGRWALDKTNVKLAADPGFVDEKRGDYTLKRTSRIFSMLKDFRPIPFGEIGVLTPEGDRMVPWR